jgi:hypothetical protein
MCGLISPSIRVAEYCGRGIKGLRCNEVGGYRIPRSLFPVPRFNP